MYLLRTTELILRCPAPHDAMDFIELATDSRDHLAPWSDFPTDKLTPERVATYLRRRRSAFDLDQNYFYLVRERATEAPAGVLELRVNDANRSGHFEGWAHPTMEGRGLAMQAALALMRVAFCCDRVARIEYRCEPDNERSIALATRLGMVHEATLRASTWRAGASRDEMVFALIAADFPNSPAASVPVKAWDALGRVVVDDLPPVPVREASGDGWARMTSHLRAVAPVEYESETFVAVAVRCETPSGESTQRVTMQLGQSPMGPWVVVRAAVPALAGLDDRQAMELNASLAWGALCREAGEFILRFSCSLASFPFADLRALVSSMAQEAARLGARVPRMQPDVTGVFELYDD